MSIIFQWLLTLLFPPRCVFCLNPMEIESLMPCSRCRDQLSWTQGSGETQHGRSFSRCVSAAWYEGLIRQSVLRFKFSRHPDYAKAYAPYLAEIIQAKLPNRFDLITWIPVSQETLARRGYDQARLLAEETALLLNKPLASTLVKVRTNAPQSSLSGLHNRRDNVADIFALSPEAPLLRGLRVLLMDDIITTGATLEEGARVLLRAGAIEVPAATFCRTRPPS